VKTSPQRFVFCFQRIAKLLWTPLLSSGSPLEIIKKYRESDAEHPQKNALTAVEDGAN
jgi:hypothetical protein